MAAGATGEIDAVNADQYARLNDVFARACELSGDERRAFLEAACGDDAALLRGVEELLANDEGSLLRLADQSPPPDVSGLGRSEDSLPQIPGYKVHARIGAGGMGVVWRATQQSTRREVAVKTVQLGGMRSRNIQARLQREIELAAALSHPNIARVFDSGVGEGFAYYAMELVEGAELDRHVAEEHLSGDAIVALLARICRAVDYAHRRGVIHRDLKPSNVLVGADKRPVLVDFGLAKALRAESNEATLSMAGLIVGTPAYMSPEQASGESDLVDTRSDVYSLGAILYRLLVGTTPHDTTGTTLAVVRRIAEEEPRSPRQALPTIDRDLEAILLKALARNPEERYGSAGALADDLERYLAGDAVLAQKPSLGYVLYKWTRRHRVAVSAAVVVVVTLLASAVGFVVFAKQHEAESKQLAEAAEYGRREAVSARQKAERVAYIHRLEAVNRNLEQQRFRLANQSLAAISPSQRGWEWRHLAWRAAAIDVPEWTSETFVDRISQLAYSPDGRRIAVALMGTTTAAAKDPQVAVLDAETGKRVATLRGHTYGVTSVAFSPSGDELLTGGMDGTLRRWTAATGELVETADTRPLSPTQTRRFIAFAIAFSPDGKTVAMAGYPGGLYLAATPETLSWQAILADATNVHEIAGESDALSFAPDNRTLAWSTRVWQGSEGHLFTVDVANRKVKSRFRDDLRSTIAGVQISNDGRNVLATRGRTRASIWNAESLAIAEDIVGTADSVCVARFLGENRQLATIGADGVVRCWDVAARRVVAACIADDDEEGRWLAVDPRSTRIAVGYAHSHRVRSWGVDQVRFGRETLARHGEKARAAAASPGGDAIATVGEDGAVQVIDRRSKALRWSHRAGLPHATAVAYSPDGTRLIVGRAINPDRKDAPPFGEIWIYDAATGKPVGPPHSVPGWPWHIECSRSGERALLAMGVTRRHRGAASGQAALVELSSGEVLRSFPVEHVRCRRAAFSPDEQSILTASETELAIWDAARGEKRVAIGGTKRNFARYVSAGRCVLTADDRVVELRDANTLALLRPFEPSSLGETAATDDTTIGDAIVFPDETRLASVSWNGTLSVWDFNTGDLLLTERAHSGGIHFAEIVPDGTAIITSGHDGFVRLWDSLSSE